MIKIVPDCMWIAPAKPNAICKSDNNNTFGSLALSLSLSFVESIIADFISSSSFHSPIGCARPSPATKSSSSRSSRISNGDSSDDDNNNRTHSVNTYLACWPIFVQRRQLSLLLSLLLSIGHHQP